MPPHAKPSSVSNRDNWRTPPSERGFVDSVFGALPDLDPCAEDRASSHGCYFYSPGDDGLAQPWFGDTVFMNPPYSQLAAWVAKAALESTRSACAILCLVPPRTGAAWWQTIGQATEVWFCAKRIRFTNPDTGLPGLNPAEYSAYVLFDRGGRCVERFETHVRARDGEGAALWKPVRCRRPQPHGAI